MESVMTGTSYDIARAASNNYLALGKAAAISASSLNTTLADGNALNDPFILSIRSPEQYAKGHIPGAVNIGLSGLFSQENMSMLPIDRQIVVVCYTGHTASQATALLSINGYDAVPLKWGMTGWTTDPTAAPSAYNRGTDCNKYPVMLGTVAGNISYAVQVVKTDEEVLAEAALAYLQGGPKYINASNLKTNLADGNTLNDPFVLSIRSSTDYEAGHIPGAVNIPWKSLFSLENLSKLPDDETQIVVVCYTGQSASQITALLNVLGFNASTLLHGMCSWNKTAALNCFDNTTHQMDYPTCSGTEAGNMSSATRTRGCEDPGSGSGGIYTGSADDWEMLRQSCERYVNEVAYMTITAKALYNNLDDNFSKNDPYIISLRNAENYTDRGHIPGAVNIPASALFTDEYLSTLPTDRQIVVYCYTGHTAGHVSALLNINGFNAVSLKFGMCSWSGNETVNAGKCYDPAICADFQIYTGTEAGEWT
jgi:rhodanese-related sulfurtransferase